MNTLPRFRRGVASICAEVSSYKASPVGHHRAWRRFTAPSSTTTTSNNSSNVSHWKHQCPQPLVDMFDAFLQQIKHHGEGSITLATLPNDKIVDIYIDNPSKRNCLSGRMIYQLMTIIDTLTTNPSYSETVALLLRGSGSSAETDSDTGTAPAFCAGLDFTLAKEVVNSPAQGLLMCTMMTEALHRLRTLDVVSVALIHGPALGGGAELATACDYRLITQGATSQIGFVHGRSVSQ